MSFYVADEFVDVVIYDESGVKIPDVTLPKRLSILQPIFSGDGLPNKIFDFDSITQAKLFFGQDMENLELYGQGGMNVIHGMKGGSVAQICRLLPEDAQAASSHLGVQLTIIENMPVYKLTDHGNFIRDTENGGFKKETKIIGKKPNPKAGQPGEPDEIDDVVPVTIPKGVVVKIVTEGFDSVRGGISYRKVKIDPNTHKPIRENKNVEVRNPDTLLMETVQKEVDKEEIIIDLDRMDEVNRIVVPLCNFFYYGPGRAGNDFCYQIINDKARDGQVEDGRRYILRLENKDNFGNYSRVSGDTYFSFNPESRISKKSVILEGLNVVYKNENEDGIKQKIQLEYFDKNYKKIMSFLNQVVGPDSLKYDECSSVNDIDFINCKTKFGLNSRVVVQDLDSDNFIDTKFSLNGGHDGSLSPVGFKYVIETNTGEKVITIKSEEEREKVKIGLLSNFFKGQIDIRLFDERLVDSDIVFDANYDEDLKQLVLQKFRLIRPDIMCIMDCGFTVNVYDGINKVKNLYSMVEGTTGYTAAVLCQAGVTKDRGQNVRVTGTYDYAYGLSKCYSDNGSFSLFAGYDNGRVTTMRYDWYPMKDEFNTQIGPLNKIGAIFAMEIVKNKVWAYMSEPTMYSDKTSKLSSIRNGMIVGDTIRYGKQELIKASFRDDTEKAVMKKVEKDMNDGVIGRYPGNIRAEYRVFKTDHDRKTDNTSCECGLYFPNIGKAWNLIIRVRRNEEG